MTGETNAKKPSVRMHDSRSRFCLGPNATSIELDSKVALVMQPGGLFHKG
jgi:hypothetical protein